MDTQPTNQTSVGNNQAPRPVQSVVQANNNAAPRPVLGVRRGRRRRVVLGLIVLLVIGYFLFRN